MNLTQADNQVKCVASFEELIITPYHDEVNAICWKRELAGDFHEIVSKIQLEGNITTIQPEDLDKLELSKQGEIARTILLSDMAVLKSEGASPVLNVIKYYDRDDSFFSTDVYSFHVDRSPVPTHTFLCTYYGEPSEILANSKAEQKVVVPEIREQLKKLYDGPEEAFDSFLSENFFDLHYQAKPNTLPTNLGLGNLWRLAVDHPGSPVPPCIHRAPHEKDGKLRLLLIC